ncbi:MAG: sigma-70 family RNA polymerase sigma factor [Ruminococcus sp.]|nr:sigma-70 family RNA polymerase sigma factor [Ruminococcus sp.]
MDKELFHQHFITLVETHSQSLAKLAFTYMKNMTDAEDIVQDVFLTYYQKRPALQSDEHEKAWLIRATINRCKNQLKSVWRKKRSELSDTIPAPDSLPDSNLMEAVLSLKEIYRTPLHLYYFESYTTKEIASILGIREAAAAKRIARARSKLKSALEEKGGPL